MSEFKKELEKNMKLNKVAYEKENIYSDSLVSKRGIERIFKDWQPPKPLVVVPKIVDEFIEEAKGDYTIHGAFTKLSTKMSRTDIGKWVFASKKRQILFARAWLDGYTVEKEKLYLLKHIEISNRDTTINCYLTHTFTAPFIGHTNFSKGYDMYDVKECHFTQSEIDDMETGSYEQIAVTFEEVEDD